MTHKKILIGINVLAILFVFFHITYVAVFWPGDILNAVILGLVALYAVALVLVDTGFLVAWLIRKKKQPKHKIMFLALNVLVLLVMMLHVGYSMFFLDWTESSAPSYISFAYAFLYLPPLLLVDIVSVIIWGIRKKRLQQANK